MPKVFSDKAAQRTREAVEWAERQQPSLAPGAGVLPSQPIAFGVCTSLIKVGSTTPGSVQFYSGKPNSETAITGAISSDVYSNSVDITTGVRVMVDLNGYGYIARPCDAGTGRFMTTTNLTTGGSVVGAFMVPNTTGWTSTTDTETFYDDYYKSFSGSSGLEGEYRYNHVSGRREIMALKCT